MKPTGLRALASRDLPAFLAMRHALQTEGEAFDAAQDAALRQANRRWFEQHLDDPARSRSWVVERDGLAVACATLAFFERPPYPGNLVGLEAYLLNVYVQPAQRRQGLARLLAQAALAEARRRGCGKVWLHATEAGRALYEQLGFAAKDSYLELLLPGVSTESWPAA